MLLHFFFPFVIEMTRALFLTKKFKPFLKGEVGKYKDIKFKMWIKLNIDKRSKTYVCYCNCNLKGQVHDFDSFADRWQQLHKNHSCRCNLENGGSSQQCKKVGGHLQYRGCTNTIIERAKNFNHAKSCLDKKTYWKNFFSFCENT